MQVGVLAAENASTAANILRSQGNHVLQLVPVQSSASAMSKNLLKALNYSSGPGQKDILDFTTQLAVMIRAGISLRAALDGIADQVTNVKLRKILLTIKSDVESGKQFSEAIQKYPKLFGPLYVNMVRASEMSDRSPRCSTASPPTSRSRSKRARWSSAPAFTQASSRPWRSA